MDFPGVDPDYWTCEIVSLRMKMGTRVQRTENRYQTIDFVEALDVQDEFPVEVDVVVCLVPLCQCCEFWTRKSGEGMEEEAVDS